ncbi:MAG: excinuclease ABC subunit UvrA [Pirellulales bacterium]
MPASDIVIKGAREHNLRNVDVVLPRNKLICLTGVSGSGKSSLAFDTLYAEGQRRYVESLSTFARQFLGQMPKPEVDHISGLSPSISISQKSSGTNPRSTVGTITEIYDFLRVLFARVGRGHCPKCGKPITAQTREQIIGRILALPNNTQFAVLAPVIRGQKGEYKDLFEDLRKQGFVRARVDGRIVSLTDDLSLDRQMRHNIEVVIDRLKASPSIRTRLAEAVDSALAVGKGSLIVATDFAEDRGARNEDREDGGDDSDLAPRSSLLAPSKRRAAGSQPGDLILSSHFACTDCGISFEEPTPQLFSFNSPQGMCLTCDGLGEFFSFDPNRLADDSKSFVQGAIELVGPWKDLGRWKRHIYRGVAETMERKLGLAEGTLLETPWRDLDSKLRDIWLWGTGEEHITFTWRAGKAAQKYGGTFEGLIPELLEKYRTSKSEPQIRHLEQFMSQINCPDCAGRRLNPQACAVTVETASPHFAERPQRSLPEVCDLAISDTVEFFQDLQLEGNERLIATQVLKEIRGRLGFLQNVGLEYLTLDRTAPTLSGGESQRIRLAGQIGCGLVGVLYILDEPSIGLHPRDNQRLLDTLCELRDLGNTVVVVEHDEDTMRAADHLIDFGPGPGVRGGEVVAVGSANQISREPRSVTGAFLSGNRKIQVPSQRRIEERGARSEQEAKSRSSQFAPRASLRVIGAKHNNLKNIDVDIPLGAFVCITGASGSGKSSLVNDIIAEALNRDLMGGKGQPGAHDRIEGVDQLDKLIVIDQSPIGRTPRSNPATYIKLFDDIRSLYTQLPESKRRGYKPGRFSFNVQGGRCEACDGNGSNRLEMDFLADVWVTCPVCNGHRFNRETLQVMYREKSIAQVLEMDVQEALAHFENIPQIHHKLQTLHDVGLDYIKIGQPSPTLSGGEAQRIKLARELVKKSTGRTLYLLDEPTTGLHFADIELLLKVLHDFVDAGNTVLVVEHNLDVVKTADWVIDIGPDGGAGGGRIVASGTPEEVAANSQSHTGIALAPLLGIATKTNGKKQPDRHAVRSGTNGKKFREATHITVRGARQHNLRDLELKIPRDEMTVFCGPSGSGKTSLAMDTIYAEGQRRYVESLSSYARQFVGQMQKPAVDHIDGLSPAIAIEQRNTGHTPRSTVGTVTEIYDYFRILFARLGQPHCPECEIPVGTQTSDQIVDKILEEPTGTKLYLMAPVEVQVGEQYETLWESLRGAGYVRVRIDGETHELAQTPTIDRRRKHAVDVIVDRITVRPDARSRIAGSVENALALGKGVVHVAHPDENVPEPRWQVRIHSQHLACEKCGRSFDTLNPHNFSFNSSLGWCPACEGLGTQTGANPAALLRDANLSLAKGALLVWPDVSLPVSQAMLAALSAHTGIPTNAPYNDLSPRQRRMILFGTGEDWIAVYPDNPRQSRGLQGEARSQQPAEGQSAPGSAGSSRPLFRFQFKGLYPALEEASKLAVRLRTLLEQFIGEIDCSECGGSRLRDDAAAVRFRDRTLDQIGRTPLGDLVAQVKKWKLAPSEKKVAGELLREIENRLTFLVDVGLNYLTLGRAAPTLSGGEAQRIRLASQVGSGLCGVLYVLDEPTIGLHPRDNSRLVAALQKLRDLGNTLLIVEHDREVIANSDGLFDFGPGAGRLGGQIVASGSPTEITRKRASITGPYLSGKKAIGIPKNRRIEERGARSEKSKDTQLSILDPRSSLLIVGARHNNLKNINVQIPLGTLTAVTGVSGSGKSSLVEDILYNQLAKTLHRASTVPGAHEAIRGIELINKVIRVDQQPLGNTPTSNPATYTGVFDLIRQLFSQLPESKLRGYTPRRFSFNVPGGRCEACEGNGQICIQMHFLPDVWVECDTCRGARYNRDVLEVTFHGKSIADVLNMSCGQAVELFANIPKIRRILQTLCDVGLDYLTLGQSAPTLSGGEAQRVKLAAELARPDTGQTLYLLDEPTTGLHFDDLAKLLEVLNRLVDHGNTVVVIEHNLDVIKTADWVIDLGPEAGAEGGVVVACGTPEMIVEGGRRKGEGGRKKSKVQPSPLPLPPSAFVSHTALALAPVLEAGPYVERKPFNPEEAEAIAPDDLDIDDVGRDTRMPWEIDGRGWHTKSRVGRDGRPCQWDGRVLDAVEQRIQDRGSFAPTNWNNRTIVEITGAKRADGWFFHAITGERWLVKLKFRTAKKTFERDKLVADLGLKPLNEIDEIEAYGRGPRVKCKNLRGPWQEVQIDAHSWQEIDTPAFWSFLERAIAGFNKFTERVEKKPEDVMPWKVLGQKWHLSKKGFPPGKKCAWKPEVLEELLELLADLVPDGQFLWNNQNVVYLMVPGIRKPWATVYTKKLAGIDLILNGPKGAFQLGSVAELGAHRALDTDAEDRDQVKLRFVTTDELQADNVAAFLRMHLDTLTSEKSMAV